MRGETCQGMPFLWKKLGMMGVPWMTPKDDNNFRKDSAVAIGCWLHF
jgi:hypothetical protein